MYTPFQLCKEELNKMNSNDYYIIVQNNDNNTEPTDSQVYDIQNVKLISMTWYSSYNITNDDLEEYDISLTFEIPNGDTISTESDYYLVDDQLKLNDIIDEINSDNYFGPMHYLQNYVFTSQELAVKMLRYLIVKEDFKKE